MRIKIVNLNKVYPGGKKALKDLNLEIEPGMFGLLGPNGAGKTSLMRIMTLLQSCTSGTIYFDDYDIAKDRKAIRLPAGLLATGLSVSRETENLGIPRLRCRACRDQGEATPGRSGRRDATQSWFI